MDYRRFIDPSRHLVAPVVEQNLWLADRRLRLERSTPPGWWRLRVRGRDVEILDAAGRDQVAPVLASLPVVRGPLVRRGRGWALVIGGRTALRVELAPDGEEPPLFAPLQARRWDELILWDELQWEGESEEAVRRAFEEGRGLGEVKGVSAALRAAFAFAVADKASRALSIPALPAELSRWVGEIADQGPPAAETALYALAVERAAWKAQRMKPRQIVAPVRSRDLESRVEESLRGAGARLFAVRGLGDGQAEVRWQLLGERFISVVAEENLQVLDAGVCLAGFDRWVTLDSLPGVIRQAMDEGALVVTHHED